MVNLLAVGIKGEDGVRCAPSCAAPRSIHFETSNNGDSRTVAPRIARHRVHFHGIARRKCSHRTARPPRRLFFFSDYYYCFAQNMSNGSFPRAAESVSRTVRRPLLRWARSRTRETQNSSRTATHSLLTSVSSANRAKQAKEGAGKCPHVIADSWKRRNYRSVCVNGTN